MAAVIANQFGEAGGLHRSALIGLGVVLFVMTIVVNMVARAIVGKTAERRAGEGQAMTATAPAPRRTPLDLTSTNVQRGPPGAQPPGHRLRLRRRSWSPPSRSASS